MTATKIQATNPDTTTKKTDTHLKLLRKLAVFVLMVGALGVGGAASATAASASTYPISVSGLTLSCVGYGFGNGLYTSYALNGYAPTVSGASLIEWKAELFQPDAWGRWYSPDGGPGPVAYAGLSNGGYTNTWYWLTSSNTYVRTGNPVRTSAIYPENQYRLIYEFDYWTGSSWVKHGYQVQFMPDMQSCNLPSHWTVLS